MLHQIKKFEMRSFLMKNSAGKNFSLISRSLALSNFLRIWQTLKPHFICVSILKGWKKIAINMKSDRTRDIKSTILTFNGKRCLNKYIDIIAIAIFVNILFSSASNVIFLSIIKPRCRQLNFGFAILPLWNYEIAQCDAYLFGKKTFTSELSLFTVNELGFIE